MRPTTELTSHVSHNRWCNGLRNSVSSRGRSSTTKSSHYQLLPSTISDHRYIQPNSTSSPHIYHESHSITLSRGSVIPLKPSLNNIALVELKHLHTSNMSTKETSVPNAQKSDSYHSATQTATPGHSETPNEKNDLPPALQSSPSHASGHNIPAIAETQPSITMNSTRGREPMANSAWLVPHVTEHQKHTWHYSSLEMGAKHVQDDWGFSSASVSRSHSPSTKA